MSDIDYTLTEKGNGVTVLRALGLPSLLKGLEDCYGNGYVVESYFNNYSTSGSIWAEYNINLVKAGETSKNSLTEGSDSGNIDSSSDEELWTLEDLMSLEDNKENRDKVVEVADSCGIKIDRRSFKTVEQMVNKFRIEYEKKAKKR